MQLDNNLNYLIYCRYVGLIVFSLNKLRHDRTKGLKLKALVFESLYGGWLLDLIDLVVGNLF